MTPKVKYLFYGIIGLFVISIIAVFGLRPRAVNLVYMTDTKYLPYMMVSLNSAIKNKLPESKYRIHVVGKDLDAEDIANLKSMENSNVSIDVYPSRELDLDYKRLGRFESFKVSLQKIFLAEYLPYLNKVLYLDADTLVQGDLSEVYETDISDKYAAAVKDGLMYQFPEHIKEINLTERDFYFNSGVMLLNLDKIRQDDIIRSAVIYFNTHNEVFGDQDVLNVVFGKDVKPLSYKYNCNSVFFEEKDADFLSNFFQESVPQTPREVYDRAIILHFAGHKPWTPWFTHSYLKPLWYSYTKEIPIKYQQML